MDPTGTILNRAYDSAPPQGLPDRYRPLLGINDTYFGANRRRLGLFSDAVFDYHERFPSGGDRNQDIGVRNP